jgi:predicted phosphate transport protein (TIGR00153 family)
MGKFLKRISLIPRESDFFEMFKQSADNILIGAEALKNLMENYSDLEEKVKKIKDIEHRGDVITHQIFDKLNKTFVTPYDRDDIHRLTSSMDDVLDAIEGIASRLILFKIKSPTPESIQLINSIYLAVREIDKTLKNLKNFDHILPFCIEINRLENEVDRVSRQLLADLFENETDIKNLLRWRDIYGRIETAADRCEDVANVIEAIVVKNA